MNTAEILIRSAFEVWPLWFVLIALAAIARKLPKHKGSRVKNNPAETLNNDMFAQFTGMPGSNGAVSPFSSSNPDCS